MKRGLVCGMMLLLVGCQSPVRVGSGAGVATQTRVAEVIELTVVARTNATVAAITRPHTTPTVTPMSNLPGTPFPTTTPAPPTFVATATTSGNVVSVSLAPTAAAQGVSALLTPAPTVASVFATPIVPAAVGMQWSSPDGQVQLHYPINWRATTDDSPGSIFALLGPDATYFFLNTFPRDKPAAAALADFHARHLANATRTYTDGPIQRTSVGGAAAATMTYVSVSKANPADIHTGAVWYVDSGSQQYLIEAYADAATLLHADAIDAIIASIVFAG